jgi:sterol desaturase/sphingolipid hydroxylase (fatty acid hydroxylase superfamily)
VDLPEGVVYLFNKLSKTFLSVGSVFSLTSLACALGVAILFVVIRRRRKNRRIRVRTIARALFPKRITRSASHGADIGYFFFSVFVFGIVLGWAVVSYQFMSNVIIEQLVSTFGALTPTSMPELMMRVIITVTLFLAYELAYWVHHYLSHRVPILWEFHKVHHTANVLTPLTIFRVHPVDALTHANIFAVTAAIVNGVMSYGFGKTGQPFSIMDSNVILVLFVHTYVHLQHTHLWIAFRGWLGCVFLSPAHHQVHHSSNPIHFNKNLGSCLAIWDWLFGTLYVPKKEQEKLSFGVEEGNRDVHAISYGLVNPLWRALLLIARPLRRETQHLDDAAMPAPVARAGLLTRD